MKATTSYSSFCPFLSPGIQDASNLKFSKANLSFDLKEVFQCTNCGVHGQFIVADGMATGPAWWKVKDLNLQELSLPADDKVTQIFEQEDK